MKSKRRRNHKTNVIVQGQVVFADWPEDGSDTQVVLLTDDEDEYILETRRSSIRPSRFEGSRVEVSGRLYERDDCNVLEVRRMRIVDSEDVSEEDGYEFGYGDAYDDDVGIRSWSDDEDFSTYARFIKGSGAF